MKHEPNIKITGPYNLSRSPSPDVMKPRWQYACGFTPPVRLKLTHAIFSGCIRTRPDVKVSVLLKGFGGDYRSMGIIFSSEDPIDKDYCWTWLNETLTLLIRTSRDEFEQKVLALIDPDCRPYSQAQHDNNVR